MRYLDFLMIAVTVNLPGRIYIFRLHFGFLQLTPGDIFAIVIWKDKSIKRYMRLCFFLYFGITELQINFCCISSHQTDD